MPVSFQTQEPTDSHETTTATTDMEISAAAESVEAAVATEAETQAAAEELNEINAEATTALQVDSEQNTPEIHATPVEFAPAIPTADMVNLNVG